MSGERSRPDVVLVTVDSWRADIVHRMRNLHRLTEGFQQTVAVAHSAATHGAFPPILASRHSVQTYDSGGEIRADVTTLPAVLGCHGYATAGIIGSNPFLARWSPEFDHFWNDGMTQEMAGPGRRYPFFDRATRFLRLQKRAPVTTVANRARSWYRNTAPPRFLWMHLMDIHGPYFSGVKGAIENGLAETYGTLARYHVLNREPDGELLDRLRALYRRCVHRLDEQLSRVFEFVDPDAIVILTGDHGEEFEHGYHGHAQLYDECVTTPLFARGLSHPLEACHVRHLDLAPSVLDALGIEQPSGWVGSPTTTETRDAILTNHVPDQHRSYVGIRTADHKFIKAFHDHRWTVEERELYDLVRDPGEQNPLPPDRIRDSEFEDQVDSFLESDEVNADVIRETTSGVDDSVKERLRELGYVQN